MTEKKWIWVCVQHPMPLLVEDRGIPVVLERIPPWGDPDLLSYLRKFNDVFDSIEKYPDFRMDFEISAREMEDVAKADFKTAQRMIEHVQNGKLGLVGGDYSQAHYHVFGSESCLRQISMGLDVFRKMFNYKIEVFFHQETGIHEQLPQILNAFGYTVAVPPRFPWALKFIEGDIPELSSHYGTLEFVHDEDFTRWRGLDGSSIPLYLSMPAPSQSDEIIEVFQKHGNPKIKKELFERGPSPFDQFMERERQKNPVTVPRILIETPDMKRIDNDYYMSRRMDCHFSRMVDAVKDILGQSSVHSTARLYAYWSYIEGVWAEKLSRKNKQAENFSLQAEALSWMAEIITIDTKKESTRNKTDLLMEKIWKLILSSQHHDIYWIETTDLKRKALEWLDLAIQLSQELADASMERMVSTIDTEMATSDSVLVLFNPCPHRQTGIIGMDIGSSMPEQFKLKSVEGEIIQTQIVILKAGKDTIIRKLFCRTEIPGLGYLSNGIEAVSQVYTDLIERNHSFVFENKFYRASINADGTISSLFLKMTGKEMFSTGKKLGNEILGHLSTGEWIGNRGAVSDAVYRKGPLFDTFETEYSMGPIKTWQQILFYHDIERIDFFLTMDFGEDGVTIGDFWDDSTKLNVYWPPNFAGQVYHDIPFGVVEARKHRPLYCINWIDISSNAEGFTIINKGTTKHRFEGDMIYTILGWGGDQFSNRAPGLWENVKKYDLRLYGKHTLEYSIFVHTGDWKASAIPRIVESQSWPIGYRKTSRHKGVVPPVGSISEIAASNIISTAVSAIPGGAPFIRAYESHGCETSKNELMLDADMEIRELRSDPVNTIKPWRIVEVSLGSHIKDTVREKP